MKVLSVIGARPQFIKASVVSRALRKNSEEILVHTGQHYDYEMSKVFFEVMGIPQPDYNLEVGSGTHGWQKARMLEGIEKIILDRKPDRVLVYGDTNSTLAGALAAVKLHVPVAHVEAGLRSFNMAMPEEVNRRLTDHISKLLFCPTPTAIRNLENEGIREGVHLVGDVMYDAALEYSDMKTDVLERNGLAAKKYLLLTVHRPVNTDNRRNLEGIFEATNGHDVVFPAHPRTVAFIGKHGITIPENIRMIKPVDYIESLALVKNAEKLLTDSGGMQKEAYFFGTPCITLREETEWVETVSEGWNVLVGADKTKISSAVQNFNPTGERKASYGNGDASQKIVDILENTNI
ncbi:MAG: UDP-N-acetylglucosamine 2-epimerase (non-hydrolyzing) [Candidatus Thermoplasmatota archaeon]|nr:UDP-N-acetylglucosamine 2-epimerase (non-hydrolyzing) [Euryarchaeota archaeon]MBU4031255.1 UDP-N-acetylglucosamine 2-epimerase (non-hydrolyzing) [Candidatus Thermoplasmatota archaeon]MBU4072257.1 UDP-N-acetylglucosamine 2-epimerase (non-hydrolyzing) [Candidatus Thermoplasmatota archaeon]MBU4144958.1 UDP-N-acetylglucosamine 2-epimerase (non-hydrolyzing) [Candidatus Thermoplasmatota archaeon]MBU4592050.1 UDP-N-acetylglucosamine 2-epimerase (non-hydrolyzing) [Candidatus Thermoplasmatota archaeo